MHGRVDGAHEVCEFGGVSGDGKRVVSGSDDMTVRVWDVETGECLKVMEGHTKGAHGLCVFGGGERGREEGGEREQ